MLLLPVAGTAKIDPFLQHTTLSIICDVRDPITKKEYSRDPRSIGRKTAEYLKKSKIADAAMFGPELEFFIFDYAWYDQGINYSKHYIGSREGIWGRGDEDQTNLGYKVRLKEGYFPTPPMDTTCIANHARGVPSAPAADQAPVDGSRLITVWRAAPEPASGKPPATITRCVDGAWKLSSAARIAAICAGVVPQHPPTMFSQP